MSASAPLSKTLEICLVYSNKQKKASARRLLGNLALEPSGGKRKKREKNRTCFWTVSLTAESKLQSRCVQLWHQTLLAGLVQEQGSGDILIVPIMKRPRTNKCVSKPWHTQFYPLLLSLSWLDIQPSPTGSSIALTSTGLVGIQTLVGPCPGPDETQSCWSNRFCL